MLKQSPFFTPLPFNSRRERGACVMLRSWDRELWLVTDERTTSCTSAMLYWFHNTLSINVTWVQMILPWRKWFCRGEIVFAVTKMVLPWRKWFCHDEIVFAVAKMVLPWRKWFCRGENGFTCGPPYVCIWMKTNFHNEHHVVEVLAARVTLWK